MFGIGVVSALGVPFASRERGVKVPLMVAVAGLACAVIVTAKAPPLGTMEHVTSNIPTSFVIARNDASSSQGMPTLGPLVAPWILTTTDGSGNEGAGTVVPQATSPTQIALRVDTPRG